MDTLPDDLLLKIFSFLTPHDLIAHVRPTCRLWNILWMDFSLWKVVHLETAKSRLCGALQKVAGFMEELTLEAEIEWDTLGHTGQGPDNILEPNLHCPNLKRLHLCDVDIYGDQLRRLVAVYPTLEELSMIRGRGIDNDCFLHDLKPLSRLRYLESTETFNSNAILDKDFCANMPDLVTLKLGGVFVCDDAIGTLFQTASRLTKLHLTHCDVDDDAILQDDSAGSSALETLDMDDSYFNDETLMRIAVRCPKLRSLSVNGCLHITEKSIMFVAQVCKQLECLEAKKKKDPQYSEEGPKISDSGLKKIVSKIPHIRKVNFSGHTDTVDTSICCLAECCRNIEDIDLSKCNITDESIVSLTTFSTRLRVVNISHCHRVTGAAISKLIMKCSCLSSLILFKCFGIEDLNFDALSQTSVQQQPSSVTSSNIAQHINREETQRRSLVAREESGYSTDPQGTAEHDSCPEQIPECFGLSVLNIDHTALTADSLMQVALRCPNLIDLSIDNCYLVTEEAVTVLVQSCRGLQALNLSGEKMTLSNSTLSIIAKFCANLKDLTMDVNYHITIEGIKEAIVGCKLLKTFSCSLTKAFPGSQEHISSIKNVLSGRCSKCKIRRELCFNGFFPQDLVFDAVYRKKLNVLLKPDYSHWH